MRRQDAVIEQQVDPRPWCEHREPLEERRRFEGDVRRTVGLSVAAALLLSVRARQNRPGGVRSFGPQ